MRSGKSGALRGPFRWAVADRRASGARIAGNSPSPGLANALRVHANSVQGSLGRWSRTRVAGLTRGVRTPCDRTRRIDRRIGRESPPMPPLMSAAWPPTSTWRSADLDQRSPTGPILKFSGLRGQRRRPGRPPCASLRHPGDAGGGAPCAPLHASSAAPVVDPHPQFAAVRGSISMHRKPDMHESSLPCMPAAGSLPSWPRHAHAGVAAPLRRQRACSDSEKGTARDQLLRVLRG